MMMARFRMQKIVTEQFALLSDTPPTGSIHIDTSLELFHSTQAKMMATDMNFFFSSEGEKIMVLKVRCEFAIYEEDWKRFIKGNEIVIPKNLIDHFIVHTVGTARGIVHAKTEGTPFNYIIIPPLDVSDMVKDDVTISLK